MVKRHWSQAFARGVARYGVGPAAGLAGRLYKRARRHGKSVAVRRRPRMRVRRPLTKGKKKLRQKKSDVLGTFVKCKDWRVKKFKDAALRRDKFARKVNSVVYGQIPRATNLRTYTFELSGSGTAYRAPVVWAQFCLDALQPGHHCSVASAVAGLTGSSNPSGVVNLYYNHTGVPNVPVKTSVEGPCVRTDCLAAGNVGTIDTDYKLQNYFRQGASSMTLQLKNVKSFGFTVEMFVVKPKVRVANQSVLSTANLPAHYTGASFQEQTPLELFELGLCRQHDASELDPNRFTHCWSTPQLSPRDSPDFNNVYSIHSKCKVYLPPGGFVEKHFCNPRGRTISSSHISDYRYDKRTTFVLLKYIAEPLLLDNIAGDAVLGGGIPVLVQEHNSTVDIVGAVYYRSSFKQMVTNVNQAQVDQINYGVISNNTTGGQATSVHAVVTNTTGPVPPA